MARETKSGQGPSNTERQTYQFSALGRGDAEAAACSHTADSLIQNLGEGAQR